MIKISFKKLDKIKFYLMKDDLRILSMNKRPLKYDQTNKKL